ncbi:MAG: N-acetylmuramidase domain-containing protein [Litorilinea sp.]
MSFHFAQRQRLLEYPSDADPATLLADVAPYAVGLEPAEVAAGARYWRVAGIYHLSPAENKGKHAIYVDVVDEQEQRVRDSELRLDWGWEGQQPDQQSTPKRFDKPDHEPATNVDLYLGQKTWICVTGDGLPSDRVVNLHSNHPDEPEPGGNKWNTIGHHSFYVVFQRAVKVAAAEPDTPDTTPEITPEVSTSTNGSQPAPTPEGEQPTPTRPITEPAPGELAPLWTGSVIAPSGLYLRTGPGVGYAPLALLQDGSTLQVLGQSGGWLRVESSLGLGYVAAHYVTRTAQGAQPFAPEDQAVLDAWLRYQDLIVQEAGRLQIDPAVAVAVLLTESGGAAFRDGRLVIRFENHIFYEKWGKQQPDRFQHHFGFNPSQQWTGHQWREDPNRPFRPCHTSQAEEWATFEFARRLDETAAIAAISMGAPQIMGFNHQAIGYATPQSMLQAFQASEAAQIQAMFRFIESKRLVPVLQAGDYREFAAHYNGPGQPDFYAQRIRAFVASFQRSIGTVTDRAVAGRATADIAGDTAGITGRGLHPAFPQPTPAIGSRLPLPTPDKDLAEADPALYEAWRKHIEQGFTNNQTMFEQVLRGFMNPYWTTVWMYRVLFGVGILAFVAAAILAYALRASPGAAFASAGLFGGLSVAAFLSYFLSRPLQALEENLQFITWLGIIYNSYWTRMAYIRKQDTVQAEIDAVTTDTIARLNALIDKHAELRAKRPGLR